jgi:hypothetical protein
VEKNGVAGFPEGVIAGGRSRRLYPSCPEDGAQTVQLRDKGEDEEAG